MSPAWVAAGLLLTLLVVALTAVVVRLLAIISSLERALFRLSREVASLRQQQLGPTGGLAVLPAVPVAASVLVTLEPDLDSTRSLALDIVAMGGLDLDLPIRVLVPDSAEGRALASDLPVPVELEHRDGPVPDGFPSAVVLGPQGAVLAKGTPASVADLRALVATASS